VLTSEVLRHLYLLGERGVPAVHEASGEFDQCLDVNSVVDAAEARPPGKRLMRLGGN